MTRTGRSGQVPCPAPCANAWVAERAAAPTAPLSSTRREVMWEISCRQLSPLITEHILPVARLSSGAEQQEGRCVSLLRQQPWQNRRVARRQVPHVLLFLQPARL